MAHYLLCKLILVVSFGLILWEIITRQKLFPDIGERDGAKLKERILRGVRPEIPNEYGFIKSLIEACWHDSPDCRPSFDQISVHLSDMLLEHAIEDPLGREFWRGMELHGVTDIEWSVFESEIREEIAEGYELQLEDSLPDIPSDQELSVASDYQLNYYASRGPVQAKRATAECMTRYQDYSSSFACEENLDLELKCLKHLLSVDQNHGKVSAKRWGDVLRWFGPFVDDNHFPSFLARVSYYNYLFM